MKICSKCNKTLPKNKFYQTSTKPRGQSYCKSCLCQTQMDRWIKRKKKAIEYKGGKCKACGYFKYYGALEFHHRDPTQKDFMWNKLRLRSWTIILTELDKCDLLCANCHREAHANIR